MEGVCSETRNRIRVCVLAYAYEMRSDSLVSDHEFDKLCGEIDLTEFTGNDEMDTWFIKHFKPWTGQWIHNHPNIEGLRRIYENLSNKNPAHSAKITKIELEDMF